MKEVVAGATDQPPLFRQEPLEARGALGRLRERPLVLQALQRALGAGQERFMIAVRIRSVVIRSVLRRVVGLDVPHHYCNRAVVPVVNVNRCSPRNEGVARLPVRSSANSPSARTLVQDASSAPSPSLHGNHNDDRNDEVAKS
jgi:hypothetical protein